MCVLPEKSDWSRTLTQTFQSEVQQGDHQATVLTKRADNKKPQRTKQMPKSGMQTSLDTKNIIVLTRSNRIKGWWQLNGMLNKLMCQNMVIYSIPEWEKKKKKRETVNIRDNDIPPIMENLTHSWKFLGDNRSDAIKIYFQLSVIKHTDNWFSLGKWYL